LFRCPYTARILRQGGHRWIEVGDFLTGTFYRPPEIINNYLLQAMGTPWYFGIAPSPDGQTWVLYFEDDKNTVYLFYPAQNTWKTLVLEVLTYTWVWSPDSQMVAFTDWTRGQTELFAATADGTKRWSLGTFPRYTYVTWDKCGGIEAVLRGD
jgi:hypothetical protein